MLKIALCDLNSIQRVVHAELMRNSFSQGSQLPNDSEMSPTVLRIPRQFRLPKAWRWADEAEAPIQSCYFIRRCFSKVPEQTHTLTLQREADVNSAGVKEGSKLVANLYVF